MMIRPMTPEDAPAVALAHVCAWQAAYQGIIAQETLDAMDVEERTARWQHNLAHPIEGAVFLVGGRQDQVEGFLVFGPRRDQPGPEGAIEGEWEINALYAHPQAWGQGVGPALMRHALASPQLSSAASVCVWLWTENRRARVAYERAGFVSVRENVTDSTRYPGIAQTLMRLQRAG